MGVSKHYSDSNAMAQEMHTVTDELIWPNEVVAVPGMMFIKQNYDSICCIAQITNKFAISKYDLSNVAR